MSAQIPITWPGHQVNVLSVVCTAESPKPSITSNKSDPVEYVDSVVLTCQPKAENTSYLWSVNSESLPDSTRLELSLDNRTLTVHGVTRNDTGPYVCETRNPVSASHSDPFILNVLYGPDTPTIFPSDSYYHPGANLSLSCHSASNPPAQYSWLINGKPQPSTQEVFIPSITVNHSGSYTCLVYNPGTHLGKSTVKIITVSEPVSQPSVHISRETVIEYVDSVVLTCSTNDKGVSMWWFFNGQSLHLMERMKLSQDNSTLTIDPVRREDAGTYQCEVSNPVSSSKSDPIRLTVSYEESTTGLTVGTSVGIAIGVLVGVALLAVLVALVVFLFRARIGRTGCLRTHKEIGNPASTPGHDPGSSSTSPNSVPSTTTAVPIYQE
ncbi:carcinoembryonic antigen-related cell adhesion molecule 1-like [Hyaena hyaena]|uniref:carcinoembryonic antigen-related cell adhesion molecule 1-like n=1 Tax=Hyaena hyaena TaxID=95912 RepID=UPI0019209609|nr:carcinoembryonic antigen-related cell adhesion molecule 1-like [Hyaena hyaena]